MTSSVGLGAKSEDADTKVDPTIGFRGFDSCTFHQNRFYMKKTTTKILISLMGIVGIIFLAKIFVTSLYFLTGTLFGMVALGYLLFWYIFVKK
jgi:hypothetical protein